MVAHIDKGWIERTIRRNGRRRHIRDCLVGAVLAGGVALYVWVAAYFIFHVVKWVMG